MPFERVRWGVRRRRTEPPYEIECEPEQAELAGPKEPTSSVEPAGPARPLCLPNSGGSEEQLVAPPAAKQVNKKKSKNKVGNYLLPYLKV